MPSVREECHRELQRVVDRLGAMPLARAQGCVDIVHEACRRLVALAGEHDPGELPRLAAHGLAAQVAVTGHDLLALPPDGARDAATLGVLTDLRRALP